MTTKDDIERLFCTHYAAMFRPAMLLLRYDTVQWFPSASSVQSALQKLVKSGLVCRSEEGYSLTDPLLWVFINGLYAQPELDISGF